MFFEIVCHFFGFFQPQEPKRLLRDLVVSCCLISVVNGMVIIILRTPVFAIFFRKFNLIVFEKILCSKRMDLYEPVNLFKS